MAKAKTPVDPGEAAAPPAEGEIGMDVLNRAIDGDKACQQRIIGLMGDPDVGGKLVDFFGNLPKYAVQGVIAKVAGESPLVNNAMHKKLASLRAELAGPDPTPIERLLAERAAYCWLVLWEYEHHSANAKDLSFKAADFHQRRIDAAHRRYMSSLRTLAQIRKLALPAVQVNIGGNQVNVAGT